ncbi:unnamed protein product [Orchesella dallaii]|uniref:Uncharacterized protein n=1 Tax=Orchesella dallaii TaxID=48710 RepID=A0ABP1QVT3_9HEXA
MLYSKKLFFLRKLASKMGCSSSSRQNDKCNNSTNRQITEGLHSCHQVDLNNCVKLSEEAISEAVVNARNDSNSENSTKPANSAVSGLLAAKLKCDEWGLERQTLKPNTSSEGIGFSSSSSNPNPIHSSVTLRNKKPHPSNKPKQTLQRCRSMMQRRQAVENLRKYRSFSSSLFRIDEIEENNEKGVV